MSKINCIINGKLNLSMHVDDFSWNHMLPCGHGLHYIVCVLSPVSGFAAALELTHKLKNYFWDVQRIDIIKCDLNSLQYHKKHQWKDSV